MTQQTPLHVSRRAVLRSLVLGAAGVVLSACAGSTQPGSSASSTPLAAPTSPGTAPPTSTRSAGTAPKSGGTIRTGQVGDIANLDGHYANQLSATTVQMAYEKLAVYDLKLQPQPVLAESWDINSDSTKFTLHLRRGVQFHNGREFTSDDDALNRQRIAQSVLQKIYQADLQSVGLNVTLKPVDGPTFTQMGQQHTYLGLRIGSGAGAGNFEASTLLQSTSAFNYTGNFAGFKDDMYAQLVLAASTEPDSGKRKLTYSELNDYLLDQSFTFAFAWYPSIAVVSSKVHALDFSSSAALSYPQAWLD